MPNVYRARTAAVREVLSRSSFSNPGDRQRVEDLIWMERGIGDGVHGMAASVSLHSLKRKYPVEALMITAELPGSLTGSPAATRRSSAAWCSDHSRISVS